MRTLYLVTAVLLGCLSTGLAQPPAKPTPPVTGNAGKDFNGVWAPLSVQYGGEEMMKTPESREGIRLSINNGTYSLFQVLDAKEGTGQRLVTAAFDTDTKANTFVLTFQGGAKNGQTAHGIYTLKGDELKICYTAGSNPIPTKFETTKGAEVFCETWKRVKK